MLLASIEIHHIAKNFIILIPDVLWYWHCHIQL